jgi:hypothetical protein
MACTLAFAFSGVPTAFAQSGGAAAGADNTVTNPPKPKSLEELLEMVADGFETERAINRRRVAEFQRNQQ